jgi:Tol biopolymer transport system component
MPNDRNPCWSPDGSRIAHERYYARAGGAGQTYTTKQTVVRVVATGEERVVSEELTRATESPASTLNGCGWIDDNHLVVGSTDWWRVVNVSDNSYLELEPGTTLLFVEVFPAAR